MIRILLILLLAFTSSAFALPVIPGAPFQSGFGMDTTAGIGPSRASADVTICIVNTLADSVTGSETDQTDRKVTGPLRYCLETLDPAGTGKVVVFTTSGEIQLESAIDIGGFTGNNAETRGSWITVAGQTAPAPGIVVSGHGIKIERNCHDILFQHIKFRTGDRNLTGEETKANKPDPFFMSNKYRTTSPTWTPAYNIVIDHCSFYWSTDIMISTGADYVTFIDNIFAEALHHPDGDGGPHSKHLLIHAYNSGAAGGFENAVVRNLFVNATDRMPEVDSGQAVVVNNLIFDWTTSGLKTDMRGTASAKGTAKISIVGNYFIESADRATWAMYLITNDSTCPACRFYIAPDNYVNGSVETDPWDAEAYIEQCNNWSSCSETIVAGMRAASASGAIALPTGLIPLTADGARTHVLGNAGAFSSNRDALDQRIIDDVTAETNRARVECVDCVPSDCVGSEDPFTGCTDAGEGMPANNAEHGRPDVAVNTNTHTYPGSWNDIGDSGYTLLEEWLHGIEDEVSSDLSVTTGAGAGTVTTGAGAGTITTQ